MCHRIMWPSQNSGDSLSRFSFPSWKRGIEHLDSETSVAHIKKHAAGLLM